MSGLNYVEKHSKVFWNTDPQKEKEVKERQSIVKTFDNGYSLPYILDKTVQQPNWQEAEDGYSTFVFTKSYGKPLRVERPCVDNSILFMDKDTKEVVGITYNNSELENQMDHYWGL